MRPMDQFQDDGKRRHEWPVFKERWLPWLAMDKRPRLPIAVVDPAYIDILFWAVEKLQKHVVFISREKENMKPTVIGQNPFDPADPVNLGVEDDELAGYSSGYLHRGNTRCTSGTYISYTGFQRFRQTSPDNYYSLQV